MYRKYMALALGQEKGAGMETKGQKKRILLLGTGGTIASVQTKDGLTPAITAEELVTYLPDMSPSIEVDAVQLLNLDSTNIEVCHWLAMAKAIEEHYDAYDGFVLCHGTDTLAYSSAALSYLIQHSPKPIVLTGSQKPINLDNTDARVNLRDAVRFAADSRAHDVNVVFEGKVICGTRVQKVRTKSYNAFDSVNYPLLAAIQEERIAFYIEDKARQSAPVHFYSTLDPAVGLFKVTPSRDPTMLTIFGRSFHAVIIEAFGVGGLPTYRAGAYRDAVEKLLQEGKTIVMTTQVPYEGSDMSVYAVGRDVKEDLDLWEAYDMSLPSVVTKLMWVLGQTTDPKEARKLFQTPINRDTLWF